MRIARKIIQELCNAVFELRARTASLKPEVSNDVPFVCQFSSPTAAEPSLTSKLKPIEDNEWLLSGANSPERYAKWAYTMCGMASFAMILEYFSGKKIKPAVLAEDALSHGVYDEQAGEEISSMKYIEFADWVTKHNMVAKVYSKLSIRGIRHALSEGLLIIVSVNPNMRGFNTASESQKGGHLVVVTGYNIADDTLTVNNPSGFESLGTQRNHKIQVADFIKFYAGRGIVVSKCM